MASRRRQVWRLAGGWIPLTCALLAAGCDLDPRRAIEGKSTTGSSQVGGEVVSTVDGHPVTIDDVVALARAGQLEPRDALRRLQDEQVLMREAERRGMEDDPEVALVRRRALVQALLDALAASIDVPREDLLARYEAAGVRFNRPELRKSVHLLAQLEDDATPAQQAAAEAFARSGIAKLRGAESPQALVAEFQGETGNGYSTVAQEVPPVPRDGPLVEPYLEALFSLDAPGVVPQPVRTSFGWHAIEVVEITPRLHVTFDEAEAELREEALVELRKEAVDALLARLRAGTRVEIHQDAAAAVASLEL